MKSFPCNLCGKEDNKVLFFSPPLNNVGLDKEAAQITVDLYGGYGRIVKCRGCGLVFTNPRPTQDTILSAYTAMEDKDYMLEQECRSINAHLSMQTIKHHMKEGRLLDVGCSTGYLLNAARFDFDVYGVEPSQWASRYAREKLQLNIFNGTLDKAGFQPASFDTITMVDVIEHLSDPKQTLKEAARLLKPGGVLYIVTPNIKSFSARLLRRFWWGLRPAHLYYFSPKTMKRILDETGFEIAHIRSYGRIFTYGYWLGRIRNFPRPFYTLVKWIIKLFGVQQKVVYINTRDSMEICAIRRKKE